LGILDRKEGGAAQTFEDSPSSRISAAQIKMSEQSCLVAKSALKKTAPGRFAEGPRHPG
jgi:hypothetical protein